LENVSPLRFLYCFQQVLARNGDDDERVIVNDPTSPDEAETVHPNSPKGAKTVVTPILEEATEHSADGNPAPDGKVTLETITLDRSGGRDEDDKQDVDNDISQHVAEVNKSLSLFPTEGDSDSEFWSGRDRTDVLPAEENVNQVC
jgi:hypothetical protein